MTLCVCVCQKDARHFYSIDLRSTDWICLCKSNYLWIYIYYYVLQVPNLVAMAIIYIGNLWQKYAHNWNKKIHHHPYLYYWSQIANWICICKSTTLLLKMTILPSIRLTFLPWQLFLLPWYCAIHKYQFKNIYCIG